MTHALLILVIILVAIIVSAALCLIIPDTERCPKCGERMEPYDDKRDVCVNPNCPTNS